MYKFRLPKSIPLMPLTADSALKSTTDIAKRKLSRFMGFPTMWYVQAAKAQTSLRIRAV